MKATRRAPRKFSANGAVRKGGATKESASVPVFKHPHPKTELEATSQRYVDSEERYRTLFNLSPMAVYSIDASGVIRDFNRHAAELWGASQN
jgi:PAS domain-containing protein